MKGEGDAPIISRNLAQRLPPHFPEDRSMSRIIDRSKLQIADRQRTDVDTAKLNELKESIVARTLLHAPVVRGLPDGSYALIAGERRVRAIDAIWASGQNLHHDGHSFL